MRETLKNVKKHGLSITEIEGIFKNKPLVQKNTKHLETEVRYQAIGITVNNRYAFLVFTLRQIGDKILIRAISARYMHKKEIENYENQKGI